LKSTVAARGTKEFDDDEEFGGNFGRVMKKKRKKKKKVYYPRRCVFVRVSDEGFARRLRR
jgi:hypothetical protein